MSETTFTVRVLNETLDIGEKIVRIGSIGGTSLLRKASLSITSAQIALSCTDDVGGLHALGAIPQQELQRIRLKKSAITPGQQLIKPAMTGAFIGIVLWVILIFQAGDRRVAGPAETVGIGILCALLITALLVVMNLGKIVWSHLAVVAFDSTDGKSVEMAIENERADSLVALFADRGIPVDAL